MCVLISTLNTVNMYLVGVDDEKLYSEEVLLVNKDEHQEDNVQILQEG